VHRDGRYVALTRKQFAVLEVLIRRQAVSSAPRSSEAAWIRTQNPFTNAVRITVSALRKRRRTGDHHHGGRRRLTASTLNQTTAQEEP